ncbi:sodium/potassium/calcium exchanger Nckx30C-like isoform X2 [Centruroides sculpturatus]|uniref:sodium/potassium/calcium exchanger Nckx30C-like isoform X2 n=1 Tax=Centruroides sculpturatus TaxID=218467 RepID=UPI000C6E4AB4|nr:sodium/potassium/calcium exchanger Nckx30C-like isoform X2 [Centruroides sculpturatus]
MRSDPFLTVTVGLSADNNRPRRASVGRLHSPETGKRGRVRPRHGPFRPRRLVVTSSMALRRPKRWRNPILVFAAALFSLYYFSLPSACGSTPLPSPLSRKLLARETDNATTVVPQFPEDLFSLDQKRMGAVALHVLGLVYMFVALAVVCDEFFVPALEVITEKLNIPEDVAGATFMAAGGSAPELFTSVIGVFVSYDDVGIGTIVGSAVFNILFVISMCVVFSKCVLRLTWWPLFRDVSFYSISLAVLIVCFRDNVIHWYEAVVLLVCYVFYVIFMSFNARVEKCVKALMSKKSTKIGSSDHLVNRTIRRGVEEPTLQAGSKFRQGLLQLMIHSIDPLYEEGKSDNSHLQTVASVRVLLDAAPLGASFPVETVPGHPSLRPSRADKGVQTDISELDVFALSEGARRPRLQPLPLKTETKVEGYENPALENGAPPPEPRQEPVGETKEEEIPPSDPSEPLDMSWPNTTRKRISYVLLAPIVVPLWITLPDVRREDKKKWFAFSFLGSILWIAAFSYLMVWWASLVGEVVDIPNEVMGMVFLAAGTSVPDLITSVLVARKGFGDMAVSSSIGSNLFDITSSSSLAIVGSDIRPGSSQQFGNDLLRGPPLHDVALRHRQHRRLQVEDELGPGPGHVLPLLRLCGPQPPAGIQSNLLYGHHRFG